MYKINNAITLLESMIDTRRKRHILGGVLISIAMLFGTLAFTVTTLREEQEESDEYGS